MAQANVLQPKLRSFGKELLGKIDSQAEAVNVEVCVWPSKTVICVAFTPGS